MSQEYTPTELIKATNEWLERFGIIFKEAINSILNFEIRYQKKQKSDKQYSMKIEFFSKLPYRIDLTPLSQEDGGGYYACIPLLKGVQSDGATPDEAINNLRESQRAWLYSSLQHEDPIPVPQ